MEEQEFNSALYWQRKRDWYAPWEAIVGQKEYLSLEGEGMIEKLGQSPLPTEFGDWTYFVFGDKTNGLHHEMLIYGNLEAGALGNGENLLVRMHSACRTNEVYEALNCECRDELHESMKMIREEGRGIVIYLEQEGRGVGIAGKMQQLDNMFEWVDGKIEQRRDEQGHRIDTDRAYKQAGLPSECRDFTQAGEMLKSIGVKSVRLLSNNPSKIAGIEQAGIKVTEVSLHIKPKNGIIESDLRSKAVNLGHHIKEEDL